MKKEIILYFTDEYVYLKNNDQIIIEKAVIFKNKTNKRFIKQEKIYNFDLAYLFFKNLLSKYKLIKIFNNSIKIIINNFLTPVDIRNIRIIFENIGFNKVKIVKKTNYFLKIINKSSFNIIVINKTFVEFYNYQNKKLIDKKHYGINLVINKNKIVEEIVYLMKKYYEKYSFDYFIFTNNDCQEILKLYKKVVNNNYLILSDFNQNLIKIS